MASVHEVSLTLAQTTVEETTDWGRRPAMKRTLIMLFTTATIFATAAITVADDTANGAVQQFNGRVAAYIALHQRLELSTPPLRVTFNAGDIYEAVEEMANAVRAARGDAQPGDIFTPEVALEFRRRLENGIRGSGYDAAEIVAQIVEENSEDNEDALGGIPLAVNQPLGCTLATTPPFVFNVLPALPGELQYRFVGRHLVLFDTHAGLVIDILTDALPLT